MPASGESFRAERAVRAFRRSYRRLGLAGEAPAFEVRFRPFAGLRSGIRYEAQGRRIAAQLSDLVQDAPAEVLDALATILLAKLYQRRVPGRTRQTYRRWLSLPQTYSRMLAARRARGRRHALPPEGRVHDLAAAFDRLNARYFASRLRKPRLGWSQRPSRRRLGSYDPAHDAITVSSVLDRPGVPPLAVDYVLFHEMLHVRHPVRPGPGGRQVHPADFRADERCFEGLAAAKRILRGLFPGEPATARRAGLAK